MCLYHLFFSSCLLNGVVEIFKVVNAALVEGKVGATAGDQGDPGGSWEPGEVGEDQGELGELCVVEGAGAGGEKRSKRRIPEYGISTILFQLCAPLLSLQFQ